MLKLNIMIKYYKKGQGHVVPINTRVINHHIYRHSYQPMYTCTMEETVSNVCDGSPNMF